MPSRPGAIRLFQISGITVFLHWSWLLVAMYEISRGESYSTPVWNVVEYVGLFVIITLHEFAHALACRSVGGRANQILLWPLGGIAYVDPPSRPGAILWSIAAGPLVNVALLPVLGSLTLLVSHSLSPDVHALLRSLTFINMALLVFNLLPVYPLDGGQILGSLLWFIIGRARSIVVTAIIGLGGVAGIAFLALRSMSVWLGLIALYVGMRCLDSLRLAKFLKELAEAPTRSGFTCPSCHARPPIGQFWACTGCRAMFDVFDPSAGAATPPSDTTTLSLSGEAAPAGAAELQMGLCPACHTQADGVRCLHCNAVTSAPDWSAALAAGAWPITDLPRVTRLRRPRAPSVAALVGGVCFAIVALMMIGGAVLLFSFSLSSTIATGQAQFSRYLATTIFALAALPATGTIWLLVRYRRTLSEFAIALERFHDDREQGVGA